MGTAGGRGRGSRRSPLELVQGIGLTRGALYHHFANKKELFRVVVELVIDEMVEKVSSARPVDGDEWDFVIDGMLRYVDLCLEPGNVQIVVVDAPVRCGLKVIDTAYFTPVPSSPPSWPPRERTSSRPSHRGRCGRSSPAPRWAPVALASTAGWRRE